jgi:hypothetical protein
LYKLDKSYGKKTFDEWTAKHPNDLSHTQTPPDKAEQHIWSVSSFHELVGHVAFLGSMNKRLALFYRGQVSKWAPIPTLFRDSWTCFGSEQRFIINNGTTRLQYWDELELIGRQVYKVCKDLGLPRRHGLQEVREVQWAVIQHYGLWPTPLIDLSSSLRVAATFALDLKCGSARNPRYGFLYVVGMPHSTGSITFDIDQNLVLARLHSCCPPVASRPHYQDGFLVGRFPMYSVTGASIQISNLTNRLIALFKLEDHGEFWNEDFPILRQDALSMAEDPLLERLVKVFGPESAYSLQRRAEKFQ